MITVNDVSLNFSGQTLFKHVDLKFTPGNCYGIIGANGAGKTTFLRILSGDLEPTTGEVVISKDQRMSVLKQDHFQYDQYTVLDTVIMGNQHLYDVMKEKDALYEKEDFTDEDGDWIHDPAKLERGLRHFYEETGVQPYVYILPNGSVRSYQELQSIAQEKYDELFTDQAHFVLVFCDDGNGRFNAAYWAGAMTGSVLDDEAINIFKAYLSQNYDDMSLTEEEIFSDAFADTADRIMTVTPSPLPIIAVCAAVIIVAVVVFLIVRNRRLAQQREAERMQEILNTPLESLADAELADLEKKYAQAGASDAPPVQPTKPRP